MASHLDCIGLSADSEDEFQQLLSDLADDAEQFDAPNDGTMLAWQDASGASIYVHLNADNTFQCATPSFFGATQHQVRPTGIASHEACPVCDVLQVEVLDQNGQMYYPLLLQLEDMEIARSRIVFKTPCQLRVAGFAERVEFWPTEDAFLQPNRETAVRRTGLYPFGNVQQSADPARSVDGQGSRSQRADQLEDRHPILASASGFLRRRVRYRLDCTFAPGWAGRGYPMHLLDGGPHRDPGDAGLAIWFQMLPSGKP